MIVRWRRQQPAKKAAATATKPVPVQLTWGERLRELRLHPLRYMRHVRHERRRGRPNNQPTLVVPVERNATGKFVERRDKVYLNKPYRTEFVPLHQMPYTLLRFGKIRRNALPALKEVELQYSPALGWHPVKQKLPIRSRSNTLNVRANARRANARANARTRYKPPRPLFPQPPANPNRKRANNELARARRAALTRKTGTKPRLQPAWSSW